MVNRHALPTCLLLVLVSTATAALAANSYAANAITGPSAFSNIFMTGINNAGQIGGYGNNGTTTQAFVSTTSGSTVVPLITGWTNVVEYGINSSGTVVGYGFNGTNDFAYYGTTSGSTAIDMPVGTVSTTGNAINDSNHVTGFQGLTTTDQAYIGTNTTITGIPLINSSPDMGGLAINATGEVGGQYCVGGTGRFCSGGTIRSFIYNGSTSSAIPLLAGAVDMFGQAINTSGKVAGYSYNGTSDVAFIGTASSVMAIPLPAGATGASISGQSLNDSGVLVGTSDAGGWIWTSGGGTVLLSSLVLGGWDIESAISISNNGLILAQGSLDGGPLEYLELEETPEPGTFLLAAAGVLLVALARERRRIRDWTR